MNEFVSMKLGEAAALCGIGVEMLDEHAEVLDGIWPETELGRMRATFADHTKRSQKLAAELGEAKIATDWMERSREKFMDMHDTFMADDMENPLKVVSWLMMSNAGGIAIWSVLLGTTEVVASQELKSLSKEAISFQKDGLEKGEKALNDLGQSTDVVEEMGGGLDKEDETV